MALFKKGDRVVLLDSVVWGGPRSSRRGVVTAIGTDRNGDYIVVLRDGSKHPAKYWYPVWRLDTQYLEAPYLEARAMQHLIVRG